MSTEQIQFGRNNQEKGREEQPLDPCRISMELIDKVSQTSVSITGDLNTIDNKPAEAEKIFSQDTQIQSMLNDGPYRIVYHINATQRVTGLGLMSKIEEIMAMQTPEKRISNIRPAADILNAEVEKCCKHFDQGSIANIVSVEVNKLNGVKPNLDQLTNIIRACYRETFNGAVLAVQSNPADIETVNGIINGVHTVAREIVELGDENYVLLSNIFKAIITKAKSTSSLGIKEVVQLLQKHDPMNLSTVVPGLRYGVNGSLRSPVHIAERLDVNVNGSELTIGLNEIEMKKRRDEVRKANQFYSQFRSSLLDLSALLDTKGLILRFPEDHFSFNYGQRAMCPVSGDTPYTEQVHFLYRILAVVEQYL